ncbi:MAG: phosphatidylserine decarboxylase [Thermodesulfobacteriota bacterium]|nr:phosphatidylserine decarboxylase [Thermodesulfobacteriota bacterium]
MKTVQKQLKGVLCLLAVFLIASCDGSSGHKKGPTYTAIVQDFVDIVDSDPGLRDQIVDVLDHQEETAFWYGRTVEDLYDFFDEWLGFLPTPADARRYMDAFYEFTDSTAGRAAVLEEPFRHWLYDFMVARGQFMDSEASAQAIPWWTNDPDMHMEDYVIPVDGFESFNDFFTRHIKPEVRPIASPSDNAILISPADSTVMKIADPLTTESTMEVKGDSLHVRELLGEDELADAFLGGKAILCMLATTDYHRFHSPVAGDVVSEAQLAGLYYGMTGGWVDYFFEHRRGYFLLDTEDFGLVGMVCVGMFTISSIEFIQTVGDVVEKGDELGHFAYGGSAILLLFEPNRVGFSIPLDEGPVYVHMGEEIGAAIAEP